MKKSPAQEAQVLKTVAEAIGSTLGRIAVKTGLAKPSTKPAAPVSVKKRAAARKKTAPKKKATAPRTSTRKLKA